MESGIFVSYSDKDSEIVEKIVSVLKEKSGQTVWFDHKLRGGENYFSVIANQIIANKYFVFIVSDNSMASDCCLRELEFAASEKRYIIAIWLDNINISPEIKLVIQNAHYINWYATTDDLFSQAVSLAFNNSSVNHLLLKTDQDYSKSYSCNQKYYLSKEDLKKIGDLLRAEENGKYSICFMPENANLLGIAYELGISTEPNTKKAALYYKASKYSGNLDGQFLYAAIKHHAEPENQEYLSEMLDAAEKGSVLAMTCIGDDYYHGRNGLPVDVQKAYEYYEKAAKKNGIAAMYYTAFVYNAGEYVQQDFEVAYMYALKAKERGFPRAYRLLAYMYVEGKYLEKDFQKAIDLFEQAVNHGDYLSLCYQGDLYGQLGNIEKKVKLYKKAVQLAEEKKIQSGMPFYRLAVLYENGIGVEQDYKTAISYYFKAIERDHKKARERIVPCILKLEEESRISYLKKAIALKCGKAAFELGMINKTKNSEEGLSYEAINYFKIGAELGDFNCVVSLIAEHACVIGKGCSGHEREQAIKWFQLFFALADNDTLCIWREYNLLSLYYFAYALEIDYCPNEHITSKDKELVLYNFKKSIDECPYFLGDIISHAVRGHLFPDEYDARLELDVSYAESILNFALPHLNQYHEYIRTTKPEEFSEVVKFNDSVDYTIKWEETLSFLKKGYLFISMCYKNGKHVKKNKDKAEQYKRLAKQF